MAITSGVNSNVSTPISTQSKPAVQEVKNQEQQRQETETQKQDLSKGSQQTATTANAATVAGAYNKNSVNSNDKTKDNKNSKTDSKKKEGEEDENSPVGLTQQKPVQRKTFNRKPDDYGDYEPGPKSKTNSASRVSASNANKASALNVSGSYVTKPNSTSNLRSDLVMTMLNMQGSRNLMAYRNAGLLAKKYETSTITAPITVVNAYKSTQEFNQNLDEQLKAVDDGIDPAIKALADELEEETSAV